MFTKDKAIKIAVPLHNNKTHCVITSKCYGSSLDFFMQLLSIAQEDFPSLKPKDVEIKLYGGQFNSGIYGIEFNVCSAIIPEGYKAYSPELLFRLYPKL